MCRLIAKITEIFFARFDNPGGQKILIIELLYYEQLTS